MPTLHAVIGLIRAGNTRKGANSLSNFCLDDLIIKLVNSRIWESIDSKIVCLGDSEFFLKRSNLLEQKIKIHEVESLNKLKKNKKGTSTIFTVESKNEIINKVNIKTTNVNLFKLMNSNIKKSKKIFIESITDENQTSAFFQELLIGGGDLLINDKKFEILGPIDSKVRLEYLFCTGEMFLPNYNQFNNL